MMNSEIKKLKCPKLCLHFFYAKCRDYFNEFRPRNNGRSLRFFNFEMNNLSYLTRTDGIRPKQCK